MSITSAIANDKLSELRHKKKVAIQSLDFDAAEEFDRQIKELDETIIQDRITKIKEEILKDLADHIDKYDRIRTEIVEFQITQQNQLGTTYQNLIDKAQEQHEKELKNIDKSHGVALLREAEREVPEQIELLEKAKAAANEGKYTEARNLREQARCVGEQQLEDRKNNLDREFDQSRSMLAAKQQNSIEVIQGKYDEELEELTKEVDLRKMETEQRFEAGVRTIRERAEIRCNALVSEDEVKEDAAFKINQDINQMLRESQMKKEDIPPPQKAGSRSGSKVNSRVASKANSRASSRSSSASTSRSTSRNSSRQNSARGSKPHA